MTDELLIQIRDLLNTLAENEIIVKKPTVIYAKEIAESYPVNLNKATEFCKKYGTNFGGWCVESTRFQEILHNADGSLFD